MNKASSKMSREQVIFLVDVQSFFASIEKTADPSLQHKPIVVAGDPERRSGVILAACPLAKQWGIETAEALWEAQQKCPSVTVVKPHMQKYIDISVQITTILQSFTDLVEPYSIDEQFMDVTPTLHLFGGEPWDVASLLQHKIQQEVGVYVRIGIGPNKVLAKMACDNFAKKNKAGIAQISHDTLPTTLWPLPVRALFGVGSRISRHLERMGIRTIGQLAQTPVERLSQKWGINGERLWLTANGIDHSPVSPRSHDEQKAIGHHMTLPRDYETIEQIKVILLELSEEVGRRARLKGYVGDTVSVGVRGARFDFPTGFHRQIKLPQKTNYGLDVFKAAFNLFRTHWDGEPIRSAGVTLSGLESDHCRQLSLFDTTLKKERLSQAMDHIKHKYGAAAILRAASLTAAGQARDRAKKIGGHYK
ncbi:nucleotidyltransferase/DNA polymerase involved in DNA repair [Caldalkalibacillus uzonensis]|uniref:DNA polymerase IV n=1 Tax=Caldalkalibacillus uzonensis TaxID=353224 RepID=A0ABU0CRS8_9BACI|nr:DNA polymerase IV [Caldalkalibacillus uzonensis]MDQ0339127.1 nucleotidyltransferase/DNA polymerase involved in DNA repair [Caldalkalibacillus uzonensis]